MEKPGQRPSAQEKVKSSQPGGRCLTGVFARDSVPSYDPCAQQTLREALQWARSSPPWAPCHPGRTPRRDHSSPGDAQLCAPELRGEVCSDVWLRSDNSGFHLHWGRRFPSHPGQLGRGTALRTLPTWLSWLWELTDGYGDMLDHFFFLSFSIRLQHHEKFVKNMRAPLLQIKELFLGVARPELVHH